MKNHTRCARFCCSTRYKKSILIQGSAGSGKSVIALHLLSYLLFYYKEMLDEQKILIFGPNLIYKRLFQVR
jgi:DNA helicase IV